MRLYYSHFTERDLRNWNEGVFKSLAQSAVEQKTEFWFRDCVQISGWLFSKRKQAVILSLWLCNLKHSKWISRKSSSFPFRWLTMCLTEGVLRATEEKKAASPGQRLKPSLPFFAKIKETDSNDHATFCYIWGEIFKCSYKTLNFNFVGLLMSWVLFHWEGKDFANHTKKLMFLVIL